MRKIIILALLAAFMALPVMADDKAPIRGVYGFAAWADENFDKEIDAGFRAGAITPLDAGKGIYTRLLYTRWNYQPNDPIQALSTQVLMYYGLGAGFDIYALVGLENYTGGDNAGSDPGAGLGVEKRLWTWETAESIIPGSLDLFAELGYTDAGATQPTGSTVQLQVGILIGKPTSR